MNAILEKRSQVTENYPLQELCEKMPDDFIVAYKGLVSSIAKNYASYQCPFDDLMQEGYLGLMRAFEKFDSSLGCKYTTYATYWIKHCITRYIAKHGRVVRLPIKKSELYKKISKVRDYLSHEKGATPTLDEIAAYAEVPISDVKKIIDIFQPELSLETPFRDSSSERYEIIEDSIHESPEQTYFQDELKREINKALDYLMESERNILKMRFGLESNEIITLKDISEKLSISSETVRQIEKRAVVKIRKRFDHLREFLYTA